jgi:pyruvate carboxylase subunit B
MRYFVTVDGNTFQVELAPDGVTVNGRALDVELSSVPGTAVRRLSVQGRTHTLHVTPAESREHWDLHIDGERYQIHVLDERSHAIRALTRTTQSAPGPRPVKAPMPGMIVRVPVAPGQTVQAGQGVIIIEAMKMENELRVEAAGRVIKVHAQAGQAVEKGAVLIEFEETQE